jgi:type I pantothenate kinase
VKKWYIERFLKLRDTAFQDERSYFHRYAGLNDREATETAAHIWDRINGRNLEENIRPTRTRADLILHKSEDHSVQKVFLKKI